MAMLSQPHGTRWLEFGSIQEEHVLKSKHADMMIPRQEDLGNVGFHHNLTAFITAALFPVCAVRVNMVKCC